MLPLLPRKSSTTLKSQVRPVLSSSTITRLRRSESSRTKRPLTKLGFVNGGRNTLRSSGLTPLTKRISLPALPALCSSSPNIFSPIREVDPARKLKAPKVVTVKTRLNNALATSTVVRSQATTNARTIALRADLSRTCQWDKTWSQTCLWVKTWDNLCSRSELLNRWVPQWCSQLTNSQPASKRPTSRRPSKSSRGLPTRTHTISSKLEPQFTTLCNILRVTKPPRLLVCWLIWASTKSKVFWRATTSCAWESTRLTPSLPSKWPTDNNEPKYFFQINTLK